MKCKSCKNKDICRYTDEMDNAEAHAESFAEGAKKTPGSPVLVNAECRRYEDSRQGTIANAISKQNRDQVIKSYW